jgi:hypothetical protein
MSGMIKVESGKWKVESRKGSVITFRLKPAFSEKAELLINFIG